MKLILRGFPIVFLLLLALAVAPRTQAQSVSAYFGAGVATDSSNNQAIIDPFCTAVPPTSPPCTTFTAPSMTGAFGKVGGDFMFNSHLGFGFQTDWRFAQGFYAGLNYRPLFFDLNAIYHPIPDDLTKGRVVPEFQGGLGGARVNFYFPSQSNQFTGTQSGGLLATSNHFQLHGAVGVKFYVKGGVFIKPQVDARYVPNFNQFGSNFVPEFSVSLGYTFGRK